MNKWIHNKYIPTYKWSIEGVSIIFDTLLQMKNYLGLTQKDTVFDYARRNDLKIFGTDKQGITSCVFHAKHSIGV